MIVTADRDEARSDPVDLSMIKEGERGRGPSSRHPAPRDAEKLRQAAGDRGKGQQGQAEGEALQNDFMILSR